MINPTCPQCGSLLFPSDQGTCFYCRTSAPAVAEPLAVPLSADEPDVYETPDDDFLELDESAEVLPALPPADQELYNEARKELLSPAAPPRNQFALLGLSLGLFVVAQGTRSWMSIAIVVAVIFLHELGHWAGMRWFSYSDLRIFFIPFFGGAASGRKEGAPQWQQAVVLLLGPLPGIVVGCSLLWANLALRNALVETVAVWLVAINAFNLLPLVPLDGGRLLNLLIFSRHRALEALFLAVTSLALVGLGALLGTKMLMILGVIGVILAPSQYRAARAAVALRERWPALPHRVSEAEEAVLRDLFYEVRRYLRVQGRTAAKLCAATMRSVYERACVRPVSIAALFGLLAAYGAGFVLSVASVVAVALAHPGRHGPLH